MSYRNIVLTSGSTATSLNTLDNQNVSSISNIEVDARRIKNLLVNLDPSKSAGPDNVPAIFLINCA
ncbi:unnamed protein product, partial [Leptidea sinapis]